MLADAGLPVVILPGNHDLALPSGVFTRGSLAAIPNVAILGIMHNEAVGFPLRARYRAGTSRCMADRSAGLLQSPRRALRYHHVSA